MSRRLVTAVAVVALLGMLAAWLAGTDASTDLGPQDASSPALGVMRRPVARPSAALVPQPTAADLWVEGVVVDTDRQPVAGVVVAIDTRPARNVVSDVNGEFVFVDVQAGRHRLVARGAAGYAGPLSLDVTPQSEPVELVVVPARTLEITVVDGEQDDAPVSGASVDVRDPTRQRQRTGADGVVVFTAVAPGVAWISANVEGRAPTMVKIDVPRGFGALQQRVVLREGRTVSGWVLDQEGTPIAGAQVRTRVDGSPAVFPSTTGADGAFSVRAVAGADLRLRVSAEGFVPAEQPVAGVEQTALTVLLSRGRTIAGVVRDESGVALGGVPVRGVTDDYEAVDATTDDEGRFVLQGVPPSAIELLAMAGNGLSETHKIEPGDRSVDGIVLVVPTQGWIRGTVVDAAGEPLANVTVHATPDLRGRLGSVAGAATRGPLTAVSDENGGFELAALRPGRFALRAVGADESDVDPTTRAATHAVTGDAAVVVVLLRGGALLGRVVHADGLAATDYFVRVDAGRRHVIADPEGAFSVPGLAAGHHIVTIDGPGLGGFVLADVEIREAAETDLGELHDDGGRSLRGRVVDAQGDPVAGAKVFAGGTIDRMPNGEIEVRTRGGDRTADMAVSDRDGAFGLSGLPPGRLVVLASHTTLGCSPGVTIDADRETVELVVLPTSTVSGTVTRAGQPAANVAITLAADDATDSRAIAITDARGAFTLSDVPIGPATLSAMSQGRSDRQQTTRRAVVVSPDAANEFALALNEGDGRVRLRFGDLFQGHHLLVVLASGPIAADNLAGLQRAASRGDGNAAVDFSLDGAPVVFDGLVPGPYTACVAVLQADVDDPIGRRRVELAADEMRLSCTDVEVDGGVTEAELGPS